MTEDIIRLRGHHFLCSLSYVGYGRSRPFIENYNKVIGKMIHGAAIHIVRGPDDICRAGADTHCKTSVPHCHDWVTLKRDDVALRAINQRGIFAQSLAAGVEVTLTADKVVMLRERFAEGGIRGACYRCSLHNFCTETGRQNFPGVKLFPAAERPYALPIPAVNGLVRE